MSADLGTVLIVDGSRVTRSFFERSLAIHARSRLSAASVPEALAIAGRESVDLVLLDPASVDGNAVELVTNLRALARPPEVLIVSSRDPSPGDREHAERRGVLGFLRKPVRPREIVELWGRRKGFARERRSRRVPSAAAVLLTLAGSEEPIAQGRLRDVSDHGAFLPTDGPLPLGAAVRMHVDRSAGAPVPGVIVRVQEPGWGREGGVAIEFSQTDGPKVRSLLAEGLPRES